MIAKLSASVVCGPKFIVPRQSRLTFRPVRPRFEYRTVSFLSRDAVVVDVDCLPCPFSAIPYGLPKSSEWLLCAARHRTADRSRPLRARSVCATHISGNPPDPRPSASHRTRIAKVERMAHMRRTPSLSDRSRPNARAPYAPRTSAAIRPIRAHQRPIRFLAPTGPSLVGLTHAEPHPYNATGRRPPP